MKRTREEWLHSIRRDYKHLPPHEHERIADEVMATHPDHQPPPVAQPPAEVTTVAIPAEAPRPDRYVWAWRIAVLLLLLIIAVRAHAQGKDSSIYTIGWTGNGISGTKTYAGPFKISLGTNMSGSVSGSTITLSASSTAATAFSGITAATNANLGTFAASGNTWDFSAAADLKLRVAAGGTTAANGDIVYDSTAHILHFWQTADRMLIAATNVGTSGQPCLSNADGSCTFADPIVSQSNASLLNATVVGTGTFAVQAAQSGTWNVNNQQSNNTADYDTGVGTQTMTMWGLALPASGGAVAGGTATNPIQVSLANTAANSTAVKVDGSGVTQPVSGTFWQATQPVSLASLSDPCSMATAKSYAPISVTTNTQLVAGVSAKKVYICSINLVAGAATNVAIVESATSGNACATSPSGIFGGSTAATGWNFAANGGIALGSGSGTIGVTATAADAVCILVSAANQVSGGISYVQQ